MAKKQSKETVVMAEKALVRIESLAIAKVDTTRVVAALRESGLTGFNPFNFDQIRVPGAGSLSFTVPTEDGPQPMQYLDVVILHFHKVRQYYAAKYDAQNPQNSPPDCLSYDGAVGRGNPGGACGVCPFSAFQGGCNPGYFVYILFPDSTMPAKLNIPRTSIANFEAYFTKVGMSGQFLNQAITRIGLAKRKTGLGMVTTFKFLYPLDEKIAKISSGYARVMASSLAYPGLEDENEDPTARPSAGALLAPVNAENEDEDDVDF